MSEELEQRYLYTVYPKKPIRNINETLPLLRVPKSLYLIKEEVSKCFENGASIYRRFSNEGIVEKFNKYEIDRVHRDKYISREDWEEIRKTTGKDPLEVIDNPAEPVAEPEPVEVIDTTIQPEPIFDPVAAEAAQNEEVVTSGYVEEVKEEVEPIPESTTTVYPENTDPVTLEELVEDSNENTQEEAEINESEEDTDVEEVDSESLETENITTSNVVVNYGGKKKKHHH